MSIVGERLPYGLGGVIVGPVDLDEAEMARWSPELIEKPLRYWSSQHSTGFVNRRWPWSRAHGRHRA